MVSVIIPYNVDRGYLRDAKLSVLNQSYSDWEIINAHSDNKCSYNINLGLERAKGEYIKILAEDDLLPPRSLEMLVKGIQGYDFVYGDAEFFGEGYTGPKRYRDKTVTLDSMLEKNGINGGGCLYRTEILRAVGGWDETLWTAEEYDLHLRLIKNGYKHRHIPGIVYRYRIHGDNKSIAKDSFSRLNRHEYIEQIKQKYV